MINDILHYQGLPFYCDSNALLSLIDDFNIRYLQCQDEQEKNIIKDFKKDLLNKGIAFHCQSNHHIVLQKLLNTEKNLNNANVILIEDDEDSRDDNFSNEINSHYQYTAEDINLILNAYFTEHPRVYVLGAASFSAVRAETTTPGYILRNYLDSLLNVNSTGEVRTLILPIEINGHWVGLSLKLVDKKIIELQYYDSLHSSINLHELKSYLIENKLINNDISIKNYEDCIKQIPGSVDCGPLLIENFYRAIVEDNLPIQRNTAQPNVARIRRHHIDIIPNEQQRYTFYYNQLSNIHSVRSISAQLSTSSSSASVRTNYYSSPNQNSFFHTNYRSIQRNTSSSQHTILSANN
ncbi:MAG: hypothetical protein ACK4PR_07795 [Gammaproteobacteria bacterium]